MARIQHKAIDEIIPFENDYTHSSQVRGIMQKVRIGKCKNAKCHMKW